MTQRQKQQPFAVPRIPRALAPRELLELFYPVHYKGGMRVEETLRSSSLLNRQQAIILWLIHSEGDQGKRMQRKAVEISLAEWYEITSSAVSKALRGLQQAPLKLITLRENPASGREKIVALTRRGERFVQQMIENGTALTRWFLDQMSADEVDICIYIYYRVAHVFDELGEARITTPRPQPGRDASGRMIAPPVPAGEGPRLQLEVFFPIHYKAGMRVEDTLRSGGLLDRQQTIILWLIHAIGDGGHSIRRKTIETEMTDWYDITSSAISQALRAMARAPLDLLAIEEHPDSGREKLLRLTPRGEQYVEQMIARGQRLTGQIIDRLADEEVDMLIHTFKRTSQIFDQFPGPFRSAQPVLRSAANSV